jgi:hypothetical protein
MNARQRPLRHGGFAPIKLVVVAAGGVVLAALSALGAAVKEEKKQEPPRVVVALPLAVSAGTTTSLRVRGNNLTETAKARFTNGAWIAEMVIKSKSKIEVPKDADARKVGNSQVEVEVSFPADIQPATNYFTLTSTNGVNAAHPLIVLPAGELIEEKEPNGGFKQAQPLATGKTLHGLVKEPGDVDVFRVEGKAGARMVIEVNAARSGSALDALVMLYDAAGHILAVNDDAGGSTDSLLRHRLPADGAYLVSVIDAQDRGGPAHAYLLRVSFEK